MVQPEGEPRDGDGHGAKHVDCVPLANEKQGNSQPANEWRALTALWSNQKENQDMVTVMEQGT